MEIEKLDNVLEALLFMSGDSLRMDEITRSLEVQRSEVKKAVERLRQKYSGDCGIHLIVFNNNVQLCTNTAYDDEVAKVLQPIREKALSTATMETIAIIAYSQPVTKLDLEKIRGVNCDYTIQLLLKHGLIDVVGRKDTVGHPMLYGTTDEFLRRFRLNAITDLPDYEDLLQNISELNERQSETTSLYNEFELPEETPPEFLDGEQASLVEAAESNTLPEAASTSDEAASTSDEATKDSE